MAKHETLPAAHSFPVWLSRQRWLPYKTRRSLLKRLHPSMLKDYAFEAEFFDASLDLRFRGNLVNYIDRLIYFCGAHEKFMLLLLRDYAQRLRDQGVTRLSFMDVGANIGNHALFMAKQVDEVHAFEPFERVRMQLEEHLSLNRIDNVTVYPFGLSDQDAIMPFYAAPDRNLGAASFCPDFKPDNYYLGDMQLKRGDSVVMEKHLRVDMLKADVEGFEPFVLRGLHATLERDRPLIVMELSPKTRENLGGSAAFYDLFPVDYRFYYFAIANYDTGYYRLADFTYDKQPKWQDVIACPQEKLSALGEI